MPSSVRRLLYPDPLVGSFPAIALSESMERIHQFGTALPMAHRIPLRFDSPARLLVRVESMVGTERNWLRAGSLAQIIYGLPGDPKKKVSRLYLDEGFFEVDGAGFPYYFEFWPYRWISDYYLEVWAQLAPQPLLLRVEGTPLTFDGIIFTIDGVPLFL